MKYVLLAICFFLFKSTCAQFKVEAAVKKSYEIVYERLPDRLRNDKDSGTGNNAGGLAVLTHVKTDTLNKQDFNAEHSSVRIVSVIPKAGKERPDTVTNGESWISETKPAFLFCECQFKKDTLEINAGLLGYSVMLHIKNNKTFGFFTDLETDSSFKVTLDDKMISKIVVPASIDSLIIDRKPRKDMHELYGKVTVTTNGYYNFSNVYRFKHNYIYQRQRIQFYFHCNSIGKLNDVN